jgi:hypothetical protein
MVVPITSYFGTVVDLRTVIAGSCVVQVCSVKISTLLLVWVILNRSGVRPE